jgi:hypothetical protein
MSNFPALTLLGLNTVTQPAAHHSMYTKPSSTRADAAFAKMRKNQPVAVLLPRTRQWLQELPSPVRPRALALQYARIANLLCAAWDHPQECRRYLNELLIDRRGGRRGFPKPVAREIRLLSEYYCQINPYLKGPATKLELVDR